MNESHNRVNFEKQSDVSEHIPQLFIYSLVLGNEFSMELLDALDDRIDLVLRRQEGDTEVISSLTLTEARARNDTDASCLEKGKGVEGVRRHVLSLGSFDGLGRKNDAWEEVHGTRWLRASEALEGIDSATQLEGTTLKRLDDIGLLLHVKLIGGISGLGRIDHAVKDDLTQGVGAEADGDHLVEHGVNLREEVIKLDVATTVTTLAKEALGDRVEAGKLETLENVVAHVVSNLTEAGELGTIIVEVLLIHLISKEDQTALDAETDDILHALDAEDLSSGVVGIDHDESTALNALCSGVLIDLVEGSRLKTPASILVERTVDLDTVEEAEKGGIERILRRGSHDANLLFLTDEEIQHVTDSSRGTISAVDGLRVAWEAITSADEFGNVLTDEQVALAVGVGASKEASIEKTLGTSNGIRGKCLRSLLHEFRVLHKGADLPDESKRLLLELLRIANVAVSDIVKRKTRRNALLLGFKNLLLQFCGTDGYNTTNLVLGNKNTRIDSIFTGNMNVITHGCYFL